MAKIEIKHRININIVLLIQIKERDFYILNSNSSERRGNEEISGFGRARYQNDLYSIDLFF